MMKKYLGRNETTKQLTIKSFTLFCLVFLILFAAIVNDFDENPLFLICLAVMTIPMSSRIGMLLFPTSHIKTKE